jgi:hypothetical protein
MQIKIHRSLSQIEKTVSCIVASGYVSCGKLLAKCRVGKGNFTPILPQNEPNVKIGIYLIRRFLE